MNELIFYKFHNLSGNHYFLDKVVVFLSDTFGYVLIICSVFFVLLYNHNNETSGNKRKIIRQKTKELLMVFGSTFLTLGIVILIKNLFNNPRPFLVYDIQTLFIYGGNESFPSGHSAFYGALAIAIFAYHRIAGIFFSVGAFLVGVSRIIAGVHFPLDIIMGFILGASVSVIVYVLIKYFSKKYKKYIDFFFDSV